MMNDVKRWIVIFRSEASRTGEVDATAVGVRAKNHLEAVSRALPEVNHPWSVVEAKLVPKGRRHDAVAREAIADIA